MSQPDRENRILDAALKLILHYGYDKTTVADIAEEAGVSKGAIYLHYASKEDLFEALWWREILKTTDLTIELMENDTEPWTFVRMYQYGLIGIERNLLFKAMMRGDRRILGNFVERSGASIVAFKRPFQSELLTLMQQVGAVRQDVDVDVATYMLNVLAYGFLTAPDHIPEADRPTLEATITGVSHMLQRYLVPEDGGNQDEAKKMVLQMTRKIREQFETLTHKEKE